MPKYLIFSFTATLLFSISAILNKVSSKHAIDNKNSMMAYFLLFLNIFALGLYPFAGNMVLPVAAVQPLLVTAITFIIGYYLFYSGVFSTDASSFAPLFQLQAVFIAVLAFIFMGERFPLSNYLYISITILGAILVSLDEKMTVKSFMQKGILLILLMQFFHAVSNLFVGITLREIGPIKILFWEYLILGPLFIPFVLVVKPKLKYGFKKIAIFFLASATSAVGAVFLFMAFQENLTIPSTIALLTSPIVLGFSIVASRYKPSLLEHHSKRVYIIRTIGVSLILIGAVKLSMG